MAPAPATVAGQMATARPCQQKLVNCNSRPNHEERE